MKTKFITFVIILAGIALVAPQVHATVGGPTYIGDFKYNKADESIYYILQSLSGRGCPPELMRTSLETKRTDVAFSCSQGEALYNGDYSEGVSLILNKINNLTEGYKSLSSINLLKNNIAIDLKHVRTEKFNNEDSVITNHFLAEVYQNGVKIDEFPITGCSVDQPFTFAGYAIPGFDKKLVIISSTKSDCWEGGYTGESLFVVSGVNLIDKTGGTEYKSYREPLVPSESRLVVYEKDNIVAPTTDPAAASPTPTPSPTNSSNGNSTGIMILIALVALAAGALLGRNSVK